LPLTRTLLQCRIDLCQAAGIDIDAVGGSIPRHPTAELNGFLNASHRALRSWVTNQLGYKLYKARGATTALPTTPPVAGETYAEIPWPTTAVDVLGVDVLDLQGQGWRPLEPIDFESRRDFDWWRSPLVLPGAPYAFSVLTEGAVSGAVQSAGTIALMPLPGAGSYALWTLPHWVDITNDTHLFLCGDEDWFQWMTHWGVERIGGRDNADSLARLQYAQEQLQPIGPNGKPNMATCAGRIMASAPKKVKAGPVSWTRSENY
jgi:hypothetical protein